MGTMFKIMSIVGMINQWAGKALADGKIDAAEAGELIQMICTTLGVKCEIKL